LFYTTLSGLWGIVVTDFIQFIIGFIGIVTMAIIAWNHIGGLDAITSSFGKLYGETAAAERLSFFPTFGTPFFTTFLVFITLKWWGNPTPAIHQRIVASKNEKHASFSTLFFSIVAFAINYWPMIVIAIVSLIMYPGLVQPERGFGMMMTELLPAGLLGLMIAALAAAFMSTVDTHINFGAAYMVGDIYKRFINKTASMKHYVRAGQVSTVLMLAISVLVAYMLDSVQQAWYYMSTLTAGYGFLVVGRWFWWRINAWSEIAALASSGLASTLLSSRFAKFAGYYDSIKGLSFGQSFLIILGFCTICWVTVTFLTKPSDEKRLVEFCRKVKPYPALWGPIKKKYPDISWNPNFTRDILHWVFGVLGIFSVCFGIGSIIFKGKTLGIILILMSVAIFTGIYFTWEDRKKS
jgi:Na+/proline symporter